MHHKAAWGMLGGNHALGHGKPAPLVPWSHTGGQEPGRTSQASAAGHDPTDTHLDEEQAAKGLHIGAAIRNQSRNLPSPISQASAERPKSVDAHLDEEPDSQGLHIRRDQGGVQEFADGDFQDHMGAVVTVLQAELPVALIAL